MPVCQLASHLAFCRKGSAFRAAASVQTRAAWYRLSLDEVRCRESLARGWGSTAARVRCFIGDPSVVGSVPPAGASGVESGEGQKPKVTAQNSGRSSPNASLAVQSWSAATQVSRAAREQKPGWSGFAQDGDLLPLALLVGLRAAHQDFQPAARDGGCRPG